LAGEPGALLRAIDIRKSYGATRALDGVSLDIRQGEFLTLLGPSGSGKTTLLMILAGFLEPSGGRLEEGGADITRLPAEKRSYGMVFQGYALFPHMSVEDNIAFPLTVRRLPAAERRRRVDRLIATVGLEMHRRKRPAQLSGGQQQRVALARALVFEPKLLLLDEPLSALDKNLREQMQGELKRLHAETGTTFVFVTHDQGEALALSTRIAIFDHGRIAQLGSPEAIYERPASRFVAEFLGRINLFPLEDVRREGETARGRFEGRLLAAPARPAPNGNGLLTVRPEFMTVLEREPAAGNAVRAVIAGVTYAGATRQLQLRTAGGREITLALPSAAPLPGSGPGSEIWVAWPVERGYLLPGERPT
jgi:putative spermidine/putrescine transport system ATP-binding protein